MEQKVKPIVEEFLAERGLKLSEEKTTITHIDQGFDFLGHNIRKYKEKLLIKPSKDSVKTFLAHIRDIIARAKATSAKDLINILNPKIRGWTNYYRHAVSKAVFSKVDNDIFLALWAWAKRRHRNKGRRWIARKYFCSTGGDNWVFNAGLVLHQGHYKTLKLLNANATPIKRHIKIRAEATPYDPKYKQYFAEREKLQRFAKSTRVRTAGSESLA
ncbi:reverse transcriptase [Legionella birminghamensis]|uniref:Reverse transcriptase n=1 Tax=Legionella birminghamensis TaxID=28083 RepID=A0A378I6S9_9GAMM|nr:reverse transcriptase [Legionella birminghamensis]STX30460.1 reverse transcriptase [Legionella birminghamensis]